MAYRITRTISDADIKTVNTRLREALINKGFGIMSLDDSFAVKQKKIDLDMEPMRILGNLEGAPVIGPDTKTVSMLPSNIILRAVVITVAANSITIRAIDPVALVEETGDLKRIKIAGQVREHLVKAIHSV